MTSKILKNHSGNIVLLSEARAEKTKLEKEIEELTKKAERMKAKGAPTKSVEALIDIKRRRAEAEEAIETEIEKSVEQVERRIAEKAADLTPLEMLIIRKHYLEGLRWNNLIQELETNPQYIQFCYEKSTYMRAHKSALIKLCEGWE